MTRKRSLCVAGILALALSSSPTVAQRQIRSSAPLQGIGQGFHERMGIAWGFQQQARGGYLFFRNGGPGPIPPFGGFDANSQAHFGWGGQAGDFRWNLGIVAGQGSSRSFVSQAPGIVLPPGGTGHFYNMIQRPFVMGIMPVVGAPSISPLQERLMRLRYQQWTASRSESVERAEASRESDHLAPATPRPRQDDPPLILGSH